MKNFKLSILLVLLSACGSGAENITQLTSGGNDNGGAAAATVHTYRVVISSTNSSFEIEGMTDTQSMNTGTVVQSGTGNKEFIIQGTGSNFQGQTERFTGPLGDVQTLIFKDDVLIYNQSITTPTGYVQWTGL